MNRLAGMVIGSALVASLATGCAKHTPSSEGTATPPASVTTGPITDAGSTGLRETGTPAAIAAGDAAKGKAIYAANCAGCHGASAQGGVGPNLHGTLSNPAMERTNEALIAWIKDPKPPMPKLYPGTLSAQDVADVAAYVKSL